MKPSYLLVLVSLLASPVLLTAQVVARQGTSADSPLEEFKLPMVLDLPIQDFKDLAPATGKDFKEVRKYYCEDLVLTQLLVTKREGSKRSKPSVIKLDPGIPCGAALLCRLAILRFDVVKGEEPLPQPSVSDQSGGRPAPLRQVCDRRPRNSPPREVEPPLLRGTGNS